MEISSEDYHPYLFLSPPIVSFAIRPPELGHWLWFQDPHNESNLLPHIRVIKSYRQLDQPFSPSLTCVSYTNSSAPSRVGASA